MSAHRFIEPVRIGVTRLSRHNFERKCRVNQQMLCALGAASRYKSRHGLTRFSVKEASEVARRHADLARNVRDGKRAMQSFLNTRSGAFKCRVPGLLS